jgi:hypothetical protein
MKTAHLFFLRQKERRPSVRHHSRWVFKGRKNRNRNEVYDDGRKNNKAAALLGPCAYLQVLDDGFANEQIIRVFGGTVQQVHALRKLGPQRIDAENGFLVKGQHKKTIELTSQSLQHSTFFFPQICLHSSSVIISHLFFLRPAAPTAAPTTANILYSFLFLVFFFFLWQPGKMR